MNTDYAIETLSEAATKIATQSMRVTPIDRVTIISDGASLEMARAMEQAIIEQQARAHIYQLEKYVTRPVLEVPASLLYELKHSQMTIFIGKRINEENSFRRELIDTVTMLGLRHVHIVQITPPGLMQGMSANLQAVDKLNHYVHKKLRHGSQIRVLSDIGTELEIKISPREIYQCLNGEVRSDRWENLPSGEINVSPTRVEGVFVCDGIPPGILDFDREALAASPLRMEFQGSKLMTLEGGPGDLAARVEELLRAGTNRDRIGGLNIGTNYAIVGASPSELGLELIRPGVSLDFGLPPSDVPVMVRWRSDEDFPCTALRNTLDVDGELIIDNGKYASSILKEVGAI